MIKQLVKYTDFNGNEQEETLYFHMSKAEITMLELSVPGGLSKKLEEVSKANDLGEISKIMYDMVLSAYGQKSEDGKRFVKNAQIKEDFKNSAAFSELFMTLAQNEEKAKAFMESLMQ